MPYQRSRVLGSASEAKDCRDDVCALLLFKLVDIAEDNPKWYNQLMEELIANPRRQGNVVHSLLGMVVQYAEATNVGYIGLCEFLTQRMKDRRFDELPGLDNALWTPN